MDFIENRKRDRAALVAELEVAGAIFRGNSCNCPFHEDNHPSAGIYQNEKGFWLFKCQACNVSGSIFDIEAKSKGMTTPEWISAFRTNLDTLNGKDVRKCKELQTKQSKIFPDIESIKAICPGKVEAVYKYTCPDTGEIDMVVIRCKTEQAKTFRQCRPCNGGFEMKAPEKPWPLYNRDEINKADKIIVVEGEKCVEALAELGFTATTSPAGAGKANYADWSPLAGKDVIVWPDNDEPGKKHMEQVIKILAQLKPAGSISIIEPSTLRLEHKGDIADYIQNFACSSNDIPEILDEIFTEAKPINIKNYISWEDIQEVRKVYEPGPFPIEAIAQLKGAKWFSDLIKNISEAHNVPLDIIYCNAIGAISSLAMGKVSLYTGTKKPLPANLYQVFIYPPSGGKSGAQDLTFEKIFKSEEKAIEDWKTAHKEAKQAKKQDKDSPAFTTPCPQMTADNCTPEAILPMVRENGNKMAFVSCEDALFPLITGLYSKKDSVLTDVVKKFFSGELASVRRKSEVFEGGCRGLLAITLGTQPVVFANLNSVEILKGDGTLSRFCYFYPAPLAPRHFKERMIPDPRIINQYNENIQKLMQSDSKVTLNLSESAKDFFWDYEYRKNCSTDDNDVLAPWLKRNPEFAVRIATNLHVIMHINNLKKLPPTLDLNTLKVAIEIIEANETHARKAYDLFSFSINDHVYEMTKKWLKKRGVKGMKDFKKSELQKAAIGKWGNVNSKDNLDFAIQQLVDAKIIRELSQEKSNHRPANCYEVNPNFIENKQ